ncbi:MAG: CheR family methyltransferase [Promethearchaeia archaeon]
MDNKKLSNIKKETANSKSTFPLVGIGCSAGSLEPLQKFFENLSTPPNISFVIVKHMDPKYKTELSSILAKSTELEIKFIEDEEKLDKNIVYIVPPGKNVKLKNHHFYLREPEKPRGHRLPIDFFFHSMAKELENKSIGVLMSGTGTDGTLGLRAIKGRGGIAIIQDPREAEYSGMLNSANSHVAIDYILPIKDIPKEIQYYSKNYVKPFPTKTHYGGTSQQITHNLDSILQALKKNNGQKILVYKETTLSRRISKRMVKNRITEPKKYAQYLKTHPAEIENIFSEILIGVTDFFRNKNAFKKLYEIAIPNLVRNKEDEKIRIWVVGCSTGEEAYSIAILIRKYLDKKQKKNKVMIFASDPNEEAINKARSGIFPENVATHIPGNLLERYFIHDDSTYKVKKEIRNMIIFSTHNVITDPPFSDLDLISCRNLLIYLKRDIQKKLLEIFHYCLRKEGYLFLGSSESTGESSRLFIEKDRKFKIFKKKEILNRKDLCLRPYPPLIDYERAISPQDKIIEGKKKKEEINFQRIVDDLILKEYSPSTILINADNQIKYLHGRTGKYLEPSVGKADLDILKMARQGLDMILSTAIKKARNLGEEIKFEDIDVKTNGDEIKINIIIYPIKKPEAMRDFLLIVFEQSFVNPMDLTENKVEELTDEKVQMRIAQLENKLERTRAHLGATVDELENANKELQSTNEVLYSSNEELKSTNEELQSSKEELQSVNEELMSVNSELENKIEELTKLNNDLNNFIRSSQIPTIFLGMNLEIKRFTPSAKEIFRIIDNDIGRNLRDIASELEYSNLIDDILHVQENLTKIEKDVKIKSGKWYNMRIMPYKTEKNRIEGTIIIFFDITEKKTTRKKLKKSEQKYKKAYKQTDFYQDLITHDFNNLLTILTLGINQLEESDTMEDNDTIELMKDQILRGGKLIKNIQRLSRVDKTFAQITSLSLVDIINEQISNVKKDYPKEDINIKFNYPKEKDSLIVNASKFLDEAIYNLLNNAIIHNESETKRINIRVRTYKKSHNDFYRVDIEDNGIGISDQQMKKIFGKKSTIEDSARGGLGIGLSIVKKLINNSNGEMWVERRVQTDYTKGTRFVLLLPKDKNPPS